METTKDFAVAVTTRIREGSVVERMVTVRANTVEEAEALYHNVVARMESWGPDAPQAQDESYGGNGNGNSQPEVPYCDVHQMSYRQYQKDGQTWWAHRAGSGWCHLKERVRG